MYFKNFILYMFISIIIFIFNIVYTINDDKETKISNYNKKKHFVPKLKQNLIDIIYIHFCFDSEQHIPDYLEYALKISAFYNNKIHLISNKFPENYISNVQYHYINHYAQSDFHNKFKKSYLPLGLSEPWEQHNFERYFVLQSFMEKQNLNWVFYADSDVIILKTINTSLLQLTCDSFLSFGVDKIPENGNSWDTTMWFAWAGTSFLRLDILQAFTAFTTDFYTNATYHPILQFKDKTLPYVCDMTIWYLFVGSIDNKLAQEWSWKSSFLIPPVKTHGNICDINQLHFDHMHGHLKPNYENILSSVHFQGNQKNEIKKLYYNKYIFL